MKVFLILFGILLPLFSWAGDNSRPKLRTSGSCDLLLSQSNEETLGFIAYLARLLEEGMLKHSQLQTLIAGIKTMKTLANPITINNTKSEQMIHYSNIDLYLKSNLLEIATVEQWAQKELSKANIENSARNSVQKSTADLAIKMRFHNFPTDYVNDPNDLMQDQIRPEAPFQLMESLLTKSAWQQIKILSNKSAVTASLALRRTVFDVQTMNYPISAISFDDAQEFINDLNTLSNSDDANIQKQLRVIIADHQPKDVYDLPTMNQLYLVNFQIRKHMKPMRDFTKYATISEFPVTRSVAEKLPFVIDNQLFYDLVGLQSLFTKTPNGFEDSYYIYGCDLDLCVDYIQFNSPSGAKSDQSTLGTGLRLVRYRNIK